MDKYYQATKDKLIKDGYCYIYDFNVNAATQLLREGFAKTSKRMPEAVFIAENNQ